jgi:hypothetical protein
MLKFETSIFRNESLAKMLFAMCSVLVTSTQSIAQEHIGFGDPVCMTIVNAAKKNQLPDLEASNLRENVAQLFGFEKSKFKLAAVVSLGQLLEKFGVVVSSRSLQAKDILLFPEVNCETNQCKGYYVSFARGIAVVSVIYYGKNIIFVPTITINNILSQGSTVAFPSRDFDEFSLISSRALNWQFTPTADLELRSSEFESMIIGSRVSLKDFNQYARNVDVIQILCTLTK